MPIAVLDLFAQYFLPAAGWLSLAAAAWLFFARPPAWRKTYLKKLAGGIIGIRFVYFAVLTAAQYYLWANNEFSRLFLDSRVGGIWNYFAPYIGLRFGLNFLLTLLAAYLWWQFLRFLEKYRSRFFEEDEVLLGLLCALLVGWPNFVIFVPAVFLAVVLIALLRRWAWGARRTTLGLPFLIGAAAALIWALPFIHALGWDALRV